MMDINNEWLILVNSAQRRLDNNILMVEDETILSINDALKYLLSRVTVAKNGDIALARGDVKENLHNLTSLYCRDD